MKPISITIGIPAHNEAPSIKGVLEGIMSQKGKEFVIKQILVLCDGCTDNTATIARSVKHAAIKVIDDGKRKGKTRRLQELFDANTSDIIIMFDGDIQFSNTSVITNLIAPFAKEKNVMLIGGNSRPYAPKTFVENAVYSTFEVFYQSRKEIQGGHNIFGCTGSILAIRKELSDVMKLPKIVCEDAYIYLDCIKRGYEFRYVDDAVIFYKLPKTFSDYVRQMFRSSPEGVDTELYPYFGDEVAKAFYRPKSFYWKHVLRVFLKNPFGVMAIILINLLGRPFYKLIWKDYNLNWFTAKTTHV